MTSSVVPPSLINSSAVSISMYYLLNGRCSQYATLIGFGCVTYSSASQNVYMPFVTKDVHYKETIFTHMYFCILIVVLQHQSAFLHCNIAITYCAFYIANYCVADHWS